MYPIYTIKLDSKEKQYVNDCLTSGWISGTGPYVEKFEKKFAKYLGVKYALTTSSGTTALHLLLVAAGIKEGDEVLLPDYTFVSTALAVSYLKAKPVFVDVDQKTWNIDPSKIEAKITPRTKAILPVDIYGLSADMNAINKIAKKHDLLVLEDSAEAFSALYQSKKVGSMADGAIFSFYGNKTITTGEGGMLVTNNQEIYKKARSLREYGRDPINRYLSNEVGFNYRLTNLQAALGFAQLERLPQILKAKAKILSLYKKYLKNVPGIIFQEVPKGYKTSAWLISLLVDPGKFGHTQKELCTILNKRGVDTRSFFPPLHTQPIYSSLSSFPVSDYLFQNGLSLPSYPTLTEKDIKYICGIIKNYN